MNKRTLLVAGLLTLGLLQSSTSFAQDGGRSDAAALKKANGVSPLKAASVSLPAGESAWSVRVIRTGGLKGAMVDVELDSTGMVKCVPENECRLPKPLGPAALELLAPLMAKPLANVSSTLSGLCADCFVTRLTLRRRESDGKVHNYFAFWDDITIVGASKELIAIANAALNGKP